MYILHILLIHNYWHKIAFISSPSIRGFLKCSLLDTNSQTLTHSYCCCNKHARTSLLPVNFRVRFQHYRMGCKRVICVWLRCICQTGLYGVLCVWITRKIEGTWAEIIWAGFIFLLLRLFVGKLTFLFCLKYTFYLRLQLIWTN